MKLVDLHNLPTSEATRSYSFTSDDGTRCIAWRRYDGTFYKTQEPEEIADQLTTAVTSGSVDTLLELIKARGGLREQSILGCLPVHLAAVHGQEECLGILLTVQPELIDQSDKLEKTPLFLSVENDHIACVEYLLKTGADPNIGNQDRETALHKACELENPDVVELLLSYGAGVNRACSRGWTALHEAVSRNSVEICAMLLRAGANLNQRTIYGITPFFLAAQTGSGEALTFLLNHGADINFQVSDGATALFEASKNGHGSVVKLLLAHKADANKPTKTQLLPLHAAAQHGHLEIVNMLIPVTSEDRVRQSGISPLHLAAQHNEDEILELLIQAGYDVNAPLSLDHSRKYPDCRTTALYFSVANSNLDAAEMLLEAGADPNQDTFQPLLAAVRQGNIQMVRLLAEHGADVNARMPNCHITFPAVVMLCLSCPPMLKILLDHGCDALACFLCQYGSNSHPPAKRPCKDDLGLQREEPCLQFCEVISVSRVSSRAGHIINLLLDYVGQVKLCARLTQQLDGHQDWAGVKDRARNPPSLKQLCRLQIRQEAGLQRLGLLHTLPLPRRLIRYLSYDE